MGKCDVAIIGAGPSGSVAASLLCQYGYSVRVIEKVQFPRFSIGESLLPQCMSFIAEAGMGETVADAGFQHKDGAVFTRNGDQVTIDFREKFSDGPGTTFQVPRAEFDHILIKKAAEDGADVRFGHSVENFDYSKQGEPLLTVSDADGGRYTLASRFVLDASGFGRVLPRLLELDQPSSLPERTSVFTHIEDNISCPDYDRNKILIAVHPEDNQVWYWLIPFSNGRSSIGVVAKPEFYDSGATLEQRLMDAVDEMPELARLVYGARYDTPVQTLTGYSCSVKSLSGNGYALLGNAGEFLDPVFSSGVTIAMKSASLIAPVLHRHLQGEAIDWKEAYASPLNRGIETFRTFVDAWYDGSFQDVLFAAGQQQNIREMIASILAGYAWDEANPFVAQSRRRLAALAEVCR